MGDSVITIVAIVLAAILMFVFPLMTMSDRTDDVSQLAVETATTDFVDEVRTTGKITPDKYSKFIENIGSTGNTYNVEMQVQVLDENPGKKTTIGNSSKIGENVYYSKYTSQILEVLNITEEAIDKMSSLSEVQPVINAMYDKISTIKKEDEKQSIVNELNLKLYKANEGKTAEEMMQNLKICTQVLTILPTLPDDKVKVLLGITFEDIEKDNLLLDSLLPKKADFHYDDGPELLYSGFEEQERVEKKKKDSASFTNPFVIPPKQKPVLEDDNKVKSNFERTYLEIFNKMAGTESDHQSPNAPVGPRK